MSKVLIIGATRGLGLSLTSQYSDLGWRVLGTSRSSSAPQDTKNVTWLTDIDISSPSSATKLAAAVKSNGPIDVVIITAGYFGLESFEELDWDAQVKMYTLSAIAPPFLVRELVKAGCIREGAKGKEGGKVVLVGSESGSVGLRHEKEGGGNYGHHGSKAAVNMVGKLLALDLKDKGIAVAVLHVSLLFLFSLSYVYFGAAGEDNGASANEET